MLQGRRRAKLAGQIGAAILLMAGFGLSTGQSARADASLGQTAPGFSLTNVSTGKAVSLDSLRQGKKATVIMFVSTRCPVSNAYNDRMSDLSTKYGAQGIQFVGINANQNEPITEVASHARDHKLTFPILKDPNDAVANEYAAQHTPEIFVIDADGNLVYHGRIDNSMDESQVHTHDLADALDDILAGKAVEKPETKAFGCSIKRLN